jgi:hypothetical protein
VQFSSQGTLGTYASGEAARLSIARGGFDSRRSRSWKGNPIGDGAGFENRVPRKGLEGSTPSLSAVTSRGLGTRCSHFHLEKAKNPASSTRLFRKTQSNLVMLTS